MAVDVHLFSPRFPYFAFKPSDFNQYLSLIKYICDSSVKLDAKVKLYSKEDNSTWMSAGTHNISFLLAQWLTAERLTFKQAVIVPICVGSLHVVQFDQGERYSKILSLSFQPEQAFNEWCESSGLKNGKWFKLSPVSSDAMQPMTISDDVTMGSLVERLNFTPPVPDPVESLTAHLEGTNIDNETVAEGHEVSLKLLIH